MENISRYLQFGCYILLIIGLYLIVRFIASFLKRKRISSFSLNIDDENNNNDLLYTIVSKFSKFLSTLVIFNGIARTYDKYIYYDSKLKNGIDYISIKILLGISFIILDLFYFLLFKIIFSSFLLLVSFILGFVIPDFYCYLSYNRKGMIKTEDILKSIIIMNNGFKSNKGILEVIESSAIKSTGGLKKELYQVLSDLKIGLTIGESFKRMYNRTKIPIIKEMSYYLSLIHKSKISYGYIFDLLEKKLITLEETNNKEYLLKNIKYTLLIIGYIIPLLTLIILCLKDSNYLKLLLSNNGVIFLSLIIIGYLLYIIILYKIYRGGKVCIKE